MFYDLVRVSDVIVENMGPGVAERLGITFRKLNAPIKGRFTVELRVLVRGLTEIFRHLILCSKLPVGIMSTTGFPPNKYVRAGISVVDISAGLHAVSGILALLYRRKLTGRGGELESVPL